MEQRRFGRTDLKVSAIGFGAWGIGGPAMAGSMPIGWGAVDDAVSVLALERAYERGIIFYDTADFYGLGHSEDLIGRTFGNRPDVVIATKVGHRLDTDGTAILDYSKKHIRAACEQSLRRLRRESIDLYQLHSARVEHFEQGECLTALEQLQQEGKVRFWGVSLNTFAPEPEARFLMDHGLGHSMQLVLNIINQRSLPVIAEASAKGYGIIARMPLQFGLLTGKIRPDASFASNDHRSFRLTPEIIRRTLEALRELDPTLRRRNISLTSLALSYCASAPGVSTVIPGIKTPAQADSNTTDIIALTDDERAAIRDIAERRLTSVMELMQKQG